LSSQGGTAGVFPPSFTAFLINPSAPRLGMKSYSAVAVAVFLAGAFCLPIRPDQASSCLLALRLLSLGLE